MKNIKDVAIDSKLIYQRLSKMEIGDLVTYKELSEIIGRNVQKEARCYLNTARIICQRDHNKTFGIIINEGLKCLNSAEVIGTSNNAIDHIRRTSKRAIKRMKCIGDMSKLTNEEMIKMNTNISVLGVLSAVTRDNTIKKVAARVQETKEQLSYVKTLEAFK